MSRSRIVPTTPLLLRYQRLAKGREEERWAEARLFDEDPEAYLATFADEFEQSVEKFSDYDNADEPFYDKRTVSTTRKAAEDQSNTYDLVMDLTKPGIVVTPVEDDLTMKVAHDRLEDVSAEETEFTYLDREPLIHRTTKSKWDNGKRALGGVRADLLLASGDPKLPAVGELKIKDDKDPFFALLQSLTGLAHLATEPQYRRIVNTYKDSGVLTPPPERPQLDCYVLHYLPVPPDNENRRLCKRAAEKFREQILTYEQVSRSVRRVVVLELGFDGGDPSAAVRFAARPR